MARRAARGLVVLTAILLFITFIIYFPHPASQEMGRTIEEHGWAFNHPAGEETKVSADVLNGGTIAGKLANETAKAELGRAAWKLLHTTMARFPVNPSDDEKEALKSYIWLFARLYPCGDCAAHFQQFLKKYPPQTSSRNAAAGWACFAHNEVNKAKGKPIFDCNKIGDFYDCGCAEDDEETKAPSDKAPQGQKGTDAVEISKEGPTRGG